MQSGYPPNSDGASSLALRRYAKDCASVVDRVARSRERALALLRFDWELADVEGLRTINTAGRGRAPFLTWDIGGGIAFA